MVSNVGSINVLFTTEFGAAVRGSNKFASTIEKDGARASKAVGRVDTTTRSMNRTMGNIRGNGFRTLSLGALRAQNSVDRLRGALLATTALAGGLGAAFTIRGISEYSDTFKIISNRLRIVKSDSQSLEDIQGKIFNIAQRSRSEYKASAVLFARIASSAKRLNISQKDTLRVTETIQKAFLVGGANPVEAAQSAIQLSQGIASNRLQGDELRSVLENPALGQLLADKITGGDIGKLRELAKEGKLTARTIIKAFKGASGEIDRLFSQTEQTIGEAFLKIDNAMVKYIGQSNNMNKGARATVTLLNGLAENIDTVADSLVVLAGVAATIFTGRQIQNLRNYTSNLVDARAATRAAAISENALAAARAKSSLTNLIDKQLVLTKLRQDGRYSLKQRLRAEKGVTGARASYTAATAAASAATRQMNGVIKSQTVAMSAMGVASRAAGSALAFIGGPAGAALLAVGAAMYVTQKRAAAASAISERYAETIEKAGKNSSGAAGGIREAAKAFFQLAEGATKADKNTATEKAGDRVEELASRLSLAADKVQKSFDGGRITSEEQFNSIIKVQTGVEKLTAQLVKGDIEAEDFVRSIDKFSGLNTGIDGLISRIQKMAKELAAARGELDGIAGTPLLSLSGPGFDGSSQGRPLSDEDREIRRAKVQSNAEVATKDYVRQVIKAESSGNRFAKNRNSSATGLGQFIESTWVNLFKKEFPDRAANLTRSAVLALRTDAQTSKRLIEAYAKENADVLRRSGQAVTNSSLQLSHFLGAQDAVRVLKANPSALIQDVLGNTKGGRAAIAANPAILGAGKTAGDVLNYADKRANSTRLAAGDLTSAEKISEKERTKRLADMEKEEKKRLRIKAAVDRVSLSITTETEKLELERRLIGASTFEREKTLKALELEEKYRRTQTEITPALTAQINAEATAYANKAVQLEKANQQEAISSLRTQGSTTFFSEIDKDTISAARSAGIAEEQVKAFINAVGSGNALQAPENIKRIREELVQTAEDEKLVSLADGMADAFGDMFRSGLTGAESFQDALKNTGKKIAELALELLVIQPLVESLSAAFRGGLGGISGGGGGFGSLLGGGGGGGLFGGSIIPGILHKGGNKSEASAGPPMLASSFNSAPKFHTGLKAGEFRAILEDTETVLTKEDTTRSVRAMGGAATALAAKGGGGMNSQSGHITVGVDDELALQVAFSRKMNEFGPQWQSQTIDQVKGGLDGWSKELGETGVIS